MNEIIEISSSPEPPERRFSNFQAKTRRSNPPKQRNRARPAFVNGDNFFELTDSDDEVGVKKSASRLNSATSVNLVQREPDAGSSRPATQLSGSQRNSVPLHRSGQAGSSAATVDSCVKHQGVPLFFSDGEEDPPQLVSRLAAPPHLNATIVDEIPEELLAQTRVSVSPPPEIDPMDTYVARVLEIIPDVQPTHVLSLLEQHIEAHQDGAVEVVLHTLFEDPTYPKIDKKGKRKREDVDDGGTEKPASKVKIDYGNKNRVKQAGPLYADIALVFVLFHLRILKRISSRL
jgi:E3 ubiquitin-protein ligase RNF216